MDVPTAGSRDRVPPGDYELAWPYLQTSSRLTRHATTLDVSIATVSTKAIDLDFSLPFNGSAKTTYVPLALLPKRPVAPDLEVRNADGAAIAIPTKRQNMALTERALREMIAAGVYEVDDPRGVELASDVIRAEANLAAISLTLLRERASDRKFLALLDALQDQFILWVPIDGEPNTQHHVSVRRAEHRQAEPIVVPGRARKRRLISVPTALGVVKVKVRPLSGHTIRAGVALRRTLYAFAVRPVEFRAVEAEAARFTSYHLRIRTPPGFLVRNVRAAALGPKEDDPSELRVLGENPDEVVQGRDSDIAHVHLCKRRNPTLLYMRTTLGLQGNMTTLWMLAAILTAGLLWLVHHHIGYGRVEEQNKQIVVAVLLVGPAFASAYSLRADDNELLRTVLSGARGLLLGSAALSVATALALAGVFPSGSSPHDMIEAYASISYFVAVPLVSAWILSARPTWLLFHRFLSSQVANFLAIGLLGLSVMASGAIGAVPERVSGLLLLAEGLLLAAIAANSVAEPLRQSGAGYRLVAGISAIPAIAAGGYFLGFFDSASTMHAAQQICLISGLGIALVALFGLIYAASEAEGKSA